MRRLLVVILLTCAAFPAGAQGHQSSPACVNGLFVDLTASRTTARPGQQVDYHLIATNLGATTCDASLTSVTFTPPTGAASTFPNLTLAGGTGLTELGSGQWTAGAAPAVAQAKAKVAGVLHDAAVDTPFNRDLTRDVTLVDPRLELTVTPDPATGTAPLSVTYRYQVTNSSVPAAVLTLPSIAHPLCSPALYASGDGDLDGAIDAAETWNFTCMRVFTEAREYSSTAVASATSALDNAAVFDSAPQTTVKVDLPVSTAHLTLTKVATPAGGFAPLAVTYSYTVLNDGPSTPISDIAVEDGACAPVTGAANPALAPNESRVFTCSAVFGVGLASSSAVATGIDTVTETRVNSAPASADVTVSRAPDPIIIPGVPTPPARVKFSYTGRFTPARSCRGTVTLTLKAGTKTIATKRVKLDRTCRYKVSFDVTRARLGTATKVTVTAKAKGKRTATRRLTVPRS